MGAGPPMDAPRQDPDQPIVNIVGEKVALGPLRRDLLPDYQRWINDFQVMRTRSRPPRPASPEEQQREYERLALSEDHHFFTVYDRATRRPIGDTGLMGIDWRNRTAAFAISIAEPAYRGRGYGTETARLMLDYAFTALGLHNVELTVVAFNLAGLRAYEKAGFREVGRHRRCRLLAGRWWDEVYMECLASEFASPVLGRIFVPDQPRQ